MKFKGPELFTLPPQSRPRPLIGKGSGPRGYADTPGTGPKGETCKSCKHLARVSHAKDYLKCGLMRPHWTGGVKTDIRAGWPACSKWEAETRTCGCGYEFPAKLGKYGCPNCEGERATVRRAARLRPSAPAEGRRSRPKPLEE